MMAMEESTERRALYRPESRGLTRKMMIDYYAEMDRYGFKEPFRKELANLFSKHNHRPGKTRRTNHVISHKTQYRRFVNLCSAFMDLGRMGPMIQSVHHLREKHVAMLVRAWIEQGDTIGTIDNKLSYFRTLTEWLQKTGMIKQSRQYFPENEYKRETVATKDKTWSGSGVNIHEIITAIAFSDPVIAMQLELQLAFGMRVEESMCYQPYKGLKEATTKANILIDKGTKGGRQREVTIDDIVQFDVLTRAAGFATGPNESMIPKVFTLIQWRQRYYKTIRKYGISRKEGLQVTSHGLRHEYLNKVFENIMGVPSAVKGGHDYDAGKLDMAMQIVVERAGHWSKSKSQAYLGAVLINKRRGRPKTYVE
ncbi:MAG: integrase domain-containing protein [Pseudomonadota bacterium]|nr:integrase domain-containing protein [Pseudomonadota bacterium]